VSRFASSLFMMFGASVSLAATPATDSRVSFVSCPIVRDTSSVPCWLAEYEGVLYFLTLQSDVSAPVNPPANPGTNAPPTPGPVSQGAQVPVQQTATQFAKTNDKAPGISAPAAPAAVEISARIPALLDQSTEDATAARALKEAESLQPRAIAASDKIGLSLVRANALAMLCKDTKSCEIIDTIKERGASTVYAEKIAIMVRTCAQ